MNKMEVVIKLLCRDILCLCDYLITFRRFTILHFMTSMLVGLCDLFVCATFPDVKGM